MANKRKAKSTKKKAGTKKKAAMKKKATAKSKRRAKIATVAGAGGQQPPYKCETTGQQGTCLKFYRNPRTGQYNLPPGGERVKCSDCEYFFD